MIVSQRSGCKVGWITYDNADEAEVTAQDAAERAARMFAEGYDFGYQTPGEIKTSVVDGVTLYEVTTP